MQMMDQNVLHFFVQNRTEWLTFLMLVITYLGSYVIVIGTTILSSISFFIHKHIKRILPLIVSVTGSAITVFLIKNIFNTARPISEAIYLESSPAFPSGHAASAIALYGFLLYTAYKHAHHPLKNPLIYFLFILIILIGLSRLYLGVHYLSDVLVGYLVGSFWLWLSIKFQKYDS